MPDTRRDRARRRLLIVLVAVVTLALCTETLFRLAVFPQWEALRTKRLVPHPVYGTFQKPNLEVRRYSPPNYDVINRTNHLGFRDRDAGFETRDLTGIWMLGASNSYGPGLEDGEVMAARIEELGYPAANLASEGHKLPSQIRVARHLAAQGFRPRALVLEMTMNNTLVEADPGTAVFERPLPGAGGQAEPSATERPRDRLAAALAGLRARIPKDMIGLKTKLINNSAVYGWLKVGINDIPSLRRWTLEAGLRADVADAPGGPLDLMRDVSPNPADAYFTATADLIARFRDWARDTLDAPLGVVLIPNHYQMMPDRLLRLVDHRGLDPRSLDPARPERMFKNELAARGVPMLDVTPSLTAAEFATTFPDDAHLTAPAHALIARRLAEWLNGTLGVEPVR